MPSTDWNKTWDKRYDWSRGGDEWTGQAEYCGQPYEDWKRSLLETFAQPNLAPTSVALEVAPGRGRWTEFLVANAAKVHLFDLNDSCIEACRQRFADVDHVTYCVNDGSSLPGVDAASVDFVWSYDSFVHMEADTIRGYLSEFARVLRPGGRFVFAVPHPSLAFLGEKRAPFYFEPDGVGYFSGRDRQFEGEIWRRDGKSVPVRSVHKTMEDYLTGLRDAGFEKMPDVVELRATEEHLELDPEWFGPLRDLPLHVAFRLTR